MTSITVFSHGKGEPLWRGELPRVPCIGETIHLGTVPESGDAGFYTVKNITWGVRRKRDEFLYDEAIVFVATASK